MLVLSRKVGEAVVIGDEITVTVIEIDRGKTRLGIQAPREIPVYRSELLDPRPPSPLTGPQILDALGVNDDED